MKQFVCPAQIQVPSGQCLLLALCGSYIRLPPPPPRLLLPQPSTYLSRWPDGPGYWAFFAFPDSGIPSGLFCTYIHIQMLSAGLWPMAVGLSGPEVAQLYGEDFFPYILLLVAILLYLPSLFWRFAATPHLCSDLKFIMEELDKVYNRSIQAAKSMYDDQDMRDGAGPVSGLPENMGQSLWEISESHFKYPIVEQYLKTKKNCKNLIIKYISCRLLTLSIILSACAYLGYYFSLSSLSDEFVCNIKSGILRNDSSIPDRFQCKLIAVGIFQLLSLINLVVYVLLAPVVIYTLFVPHRQKTDVLRVYEILPTFDVLHFKSEGYNDLSLYNLFLEENVSELKSYRCLKVLENIKSSGQGINPMLLLTHLGTIKMDVMDGKRPEPVEMTTEEPGDPMTELKDSNEPSEIKVNNGETNARQRLLDSSC
ncbi:hypothetical protein GH733_007256 [Mirounga leonina]|nr:hypothetical protein GH733_007256 [Mirounga leonina]